MPLYLLGRLRIFHTPFSKQPWSSPFQIRHSAWLPLLRCAGVFIGIQWVAKQMGHVNVEMVMRTYGKWIPDNSITAGYQPVNDWGQHLDLNKKQNIPICLPRGEKTTLLKKNYL